MNPGLIVLKNIFKTLKLIRCLESSMHSRNEFEKSYLPPKGIFKKKYFMYLRQI